MRKISLLLFLFMLFPSLFAQQKKKTVAVLEFQSGGTLDKAEAFTLTNRFRALLVKTQAFQVAEREKMNEILKAQDFNMSDACNSAECAVQVGQLLGVEVMVAGDIGKLGETYTIDLRLIDVQSGGVIQSQSKNHQGKIDGLLDVMETMANAIADASEGKTAIIRYKLAIKTSLPKNALIQKTIVLIDGDSVGLNKAEVSLKEGKHLIVVTTKHPDFTVFSKEITLTSDQSIDAKLDFSDAYKKRIADEEARARAALALAEKEKLAKEMAERQRIKAEKELAEKQKAEREKLEKEKAKAERSKTISSSAIGNKKWWYIIGGAAVLGGGAAVLMSGGGEKKKISPLPEMDLPPNQ